MKLVFQFILFLVILAIIPTTNALSNMTFEQGIAPDTYTRQAFGNNNYGTVTTLIIGTLNNYNSYILFNLSKLGNIGDITQANVTIYDKSSSPNMNINVYFVNDSTQVNYFGETTTTWNNQPCGISKTVLNDSCNSTIISTIDSTSSGLRTFDVTPAANWVSSNFPTGNKALLLVLTNLSDDFTLTDRTFVSKENGTNPAYMSIIYDLQELDIIPPIINILSPTNITYTTKSTWFNVSLNEVGNSCLYSLDNSANISMTNSSGNWNAQNSSMTDGSHSVKFSCSDISGNMNSSMENSYFSIDTYPFFSQYSSNNTVAGLTTKHQVYWSDIIGLSGYIFSFNNGTGSFINDSWIQFLGVGNWSNVTKSINSSIDSTIQWKVYANDTNNNWNITDTYSYITSGSDTCTPPTLNNDWSITDTCSKISNNINIGTGKLTIGNGGLLILNNTNVTAGSFEMLGTGQKVNIFSGKISII
jgi:hypothetical protein